MDKQPNFSVRIDANIESLKAIILKERFGDLDQDYDACMALLELSIQMDYPYGMAFAYAYLGDCLIGKNESANAYPHLMRAKELCEKNRWLDLLPNVCSWLGVYYDMQNDRQMAMHYFLDALDFAQRNNDLMRQSILLNNIASQFQICGSYVHAKEYYKKAFRIFQQVESFDVKDPHYAQMTANMVSVCCRLKDVEDANYYFQLLQQSGLTRQNENQMFLCELLISSAGGDLEKVRGSVDQLLLEMKGHPHDLRQFFETFLVVAESMVELKEEYYASTILNELYGLCGEEDYGNKLRVQYVYMQYYQYFGTQEEKNKAYEQFYVLRQMNDKILNRNLSEGLLSKIKLRESDQKNAEMEKSKEQLEGEAQLDELTQLLNRRSLRRLLEATADDQEVRTLSYVMIDVDYFKQYNDTYGHAKGDNALRAVADAMRASSDCDISSFRYGGDEFVAVCCNKILQEVAEYVHRVLEHLRKKAIPHATSLCAGQLSLSVGFSHQVRQDGQTICTEELMSQADQALYRAKAKGRNCYACFAEVSDQIRT